jgi:hypothetical protein
MEHLRFVERGEGLVKRGPAALVDLAGRECVRNRCVVSEGLDDTNDVGVFQEDEFARIEVISERAEWFGAQSDLRMQVE